MKDLTELGEMIDSKIGELVYPKSPKLLYDPIQFIMGLKGKRMRPLLVLIAHQLFDENIERALHPAMAIEMFHNFTLLHDDIMDEAPLRRGRPTVYQKWGRNTAILSGDVMMIKAYQLLEKLDENILKDVVSIFSETAIKVCEGQQWDMDFEEEKHVTLSQYMKMIEYKTAILLAASLKIGAITAGATKDDQDNLHNFGINMGLAFQLKDDLLDVFGSPADFGKQVGGDILANKKTFLYLKALQLADITDKQKLQFYYTNNDKSDKKINEVSNIFKNLDIQRHTTDMMRAFHTKAMQHLDSISSNNKQPLFVFSERLMDRIS